MRKDTEITYSIVEGQADLKNATFKMQDGATVASLITYMLHKSLDVKFAGYSIPHPLENNVLVRLQIKESSPRTAEEVWKEALLNLRDTTSHLQTIFKVLFGKYDEEATSKTLTA